MKNKVLCCFLLITVFSISIMISGCESLNNSNSTKDETLKDIAYDVNEKFGYTVYIKENSAFVPYLVLTSDYNGQALLLRKELLAEGRSFNYGNGYLGYYKDSSIDKFLNSVFLTTLEPEIQKSIVDSEITITSTSSLGFVGKDTENIFRKVFLLSYTEVGRREIGMACVEGKPLKYFKDSNNIIAYHNNEAQSWWLRTSYTTDTSLAWGIGLEGTIGGGGVGNKNGVRPAFCLKNTHAIEKNDEVLEGQTVYVIAN